MELSSQNTSEVAAMSRQERADLGALSDLTTPWCLRVAVTLQIAEQIAAGITAIDKLAAAAHCDAPSLQRVLAHLVAKGVFEQPAPGQFTLNEAAQDLLDPALRLGLDLDGFGSRMADIWSGLLGSVRTGKPTHQEVFGLPFWEDLEAHPDIAESFDALMGPPGHGTPDPEIQLAEGWESVRTVVDVGGGTGALLAQVLQAQPDVRGTLVDLPRTVARSHEIFEAAGVADRVTTAAQSFFDPLPAGADLYLLKSILADWPDGEATAILSRCATAARPGGRIVVLNGVSPDPGPADLMMMVLVGGKQRSLAEFEELAREAKLEVSAAGWQPSGRFVVECRPTPPEGAAHAG
jgi:SAM-dependent methyltransferase